MTRILIVADILLYREGLALILGREARVTPVAAVADVPSALRAFREHEPDVVLLDAAVPNVLGAVGRLIRAEPEMRIVVLGVDEREGEVIAYAEAGVSGYVTRNADRSALCDTLETVAVGGALCSPRMTAALLRRVAALAPQRAEAAKASRLTLREREIVALMRDGLSNKEIAHQLCIEVATVKNHVHNILDKLDVRRRGEVAAMLRSSV